MLKIIRPDYYWPETTLTMFPLLVKHVERCGRVCYRSEDRITEDSADRFVSMICRNRHESVLEHATVTVIIVCSRACSHQLVRHRIAAYSQASMRYINYGKDNNLKIICPPSVGLAPGTYFYDDRPLYGGWFKHREGPILADRISEGDQVAWLSLIRACYGEYKRELSIGMKPEDARYVLPNATMTELATTFNLRQWRHVFRERALNKHAQWEIRSIFSNILEDLAARLPAVFADLVEVSDGLES